MNSISPVCEAWEEFSSVPSSPLRGYSFFNDQPNPHLLSGAQPNGNCSSRFFEIVSSFIWLYSPAYL